MTTKLDDATWRATVSRLVDEGVIDMFLPVDDIPGRSGIDIESSDDLDEVALRAAVVPDDYAPVHAWARRKAEREAIGSDRPLPVVIPCAGWNLGG